MKINAQLLTQPYGDDLQIANAARVSFHKTSSWQDDGSLKPEDARLIKFLARGCTAKEWDETIDTLMQAEGLLSESEIHETLVKVRNMPQHWTPFGHTYMTFVVQAPIFVARQLFRHKVGLVESEISRRYIDEEPEFWHPGIGQWRDRGSAKQGSGDNNITLEDGLYEQDIAGDYFLQSAGLYKRMLSEGVAPEMARSVLPQSLFTEWWWSGTIQAFARICQQRLDPHAQAETQKVAQDISAQIRPYFPVAWPALMGDYYG